SNDASAVRVKLQIDSSEEDDINGKQAGEVWVGQELTLSAVVDAPAGLATTYKWDLKGDTFASYSPSVYSAVRFDLDTASKSAGKITYHYADGGAEDASCSVNVGGTEFPMTTTLDVKKPDSMLTGNFGWLGSYGIVQGNAMEYWAGWRGIATPTGQVG